MLITKKIMNNCGKYGRNMVIYKKTMKVECSEESIAIVYKKVHLFVNNGFTVHRIFQVA